MSARACRRGRHVVAVFTLWLLAAACATTPGLQKADDSRAQGWRDQAARDYADALRREQLTPGERARARVAIRELTVELVDQDALRWVESEDPLAVAEPLARLRGRVDKLDEPQVSARYNARVSRYLERHRPTLEALRIQHRFVPAMALASALTTPLAADDPRQSLLRQVQDEGRDWHLAQAQVAQPYVVAVQFHLSMARRLGAELSPTQKAAVQAGEVAASFGWDLAGPAASCAADLQELVGRLGTGGGRAGARRISQRAVQRERQKLRPQRSLHLPSGLPSPRGAASGRWSRGLSRDGYPPGTRVLLGMGERHGTIRPLPAALHNRAAQL